MFRWLLYWRRGGLGGGDTCRKLNFCISVVATKKVLVRQAATVGECENNAAVWHGAELSKCNICATNWGWVAVFFFKFETIRDWN